MQAQKPRIPTRQQFVPAALVAICALIATLVWHGQATNATPSDLDDTINPADVIAQEYRRNPAAAAAHYQGRMIYVSGSVEALWLKRESPIVRLDGVTCLFNPDQAAEVSRLHRGTVIVVQGACVQLRQVFVTDCVLEQVG